MSHVFRHKRDLTRFGFERAFRWLYWHQYTATEASYRAIAEGTDIDRIKIRRTYSKREEKGLWWFANCAVGVSISSAIRHNRSKLLRRAFTDALTTRGYEKDGSRTESDERLPLTGTLQIFGTAKAVETAKWEDLRSQLLKMLDEITKARSTKQWSSATVSHAQQSAQWQDQGQRGSGVDGPGRQPSRNKPTITRRVDFTDELADKW